MNVAVGDKFQFSLGTHSSSRLRFDYFCSAVSLLKRMGVRLRMIVVTRLIVASLTVAAAKQGAQVKVIVP